MAWTLTGLLGAAGIEADVRGDATVTGLAYDSRRVASGDLFCCWPGENVDGHDFASDAIRSGAGSLLVERFLPVNVPQARVSGVHAVLGPLAAAFFGRPSDELTIAAVTGTNGKTTTTYLFEAIARAAGRPVGVIGNVSRRYAGITEEAGRNTPEATDLNALFRRMLDAKTELAIIEATSDGLAAGRLRGTRIATAAFTNLTQDHLNTHGSIQAYFEAKALLFTDGYTERAVINIDDPYGRALVDRVEGSLRVTTYGSERGDIHCSSARLTVSGTDVDVITPVGDASLRTHLVGPYNVSNAMCAIGLALDVGLTLDDAVLGIESLASVPGRLERVDSGQPFLALVDYAHTPDALEKALGAVRMLASGRVIVVFGCGGDRDRAKRPQMGEIATRLADLTFITSDNPRSEHPDAIVAEIAAGATGGGAYETIAERREAIAAAIEHAREGDVVLVAGKGHEQGQQFADRTVPFDDVTAVREALEDFAHA